MFLDDEIVKTVINSTEDHTKTCTKILLMCTEKLSRDLKLNMVDSNILPSAKRACNLFDSAAKQLNKKGYPFLKEGGLKEVLLNGEMGDILKNLGL